MKPIADLRKNYELGELDESQAPHDPLELFAGGSTRPLRGSFPSRPR